MKKKDLKLINTKMLFGDKLNEIEIMHNGISYILSISKDNKLILTK